MNIIAQILGCLGLLSLFISFLYNKKNIVMQSQIASNIFFAGQYFLLGAISGMIMCIISGIRYLVVGLFEKNNKKVPFYIPFIFIIIIILPVFFMHFNVIEMFPIIANLLYSIAIFSKNKKALRIVTLITSSLFIGYNTFFRAYPSLIGNIIELLISFVAIYKFDINEKTSRK